MSTFAVTVERVKIFPHSNADRLEIAQVGDYQCIVAKNQFQDGSLVVYIPEQALVPVWILKKLGLWDEKAKKGKLAGKQGNRVKSIKLRGVLSTGLLFPLEKEG